MELKKVDKAFQVAEQLSFENMLNSSSSNGIEMWVQGQNKKVRPTFSKTQNVEKKPINI